MAHDHIREQAEYFANIPLIDRKVRASVHLEAEADVLFWDTMFQRYRPGKYHYIYHIHRLFPVLFESRRAEDPPLLSAGSPLRLRERISDRSPPLR